MSVGEFHVEEEVSTVERCTGLRGIPSLGLLGKEEHGEVATLLVVNVGDHANLAVGSECDGLVEFCGVVLELRISNVIPCALAFELLSRVGHEFVVLIIVLGVYSGEGEVALAVDVTDGNA